MKKDIYDRFAFIETQLCWGDGLTARELGEASGLARQNAQSVITEYRRRHPDNIRFDRSKKRQVATAEFSPQYVRSDPESFLDYQRAIAMMAYYKESDDWIDLPFQDVDRLLRPSLDEERVRSVLAALRREQAVTIYYHAKTSARMRDISPNQLIFASNRYHIRAYCHTTNAFLDFVLSRIVHVESSDTEWVSSSNDTEWNTRVTLSFQLNPKLPEEAIAALLCDHAITEDRIWPVNCNQALAYYVERELLAVDPKYQCSRWILIKKGKPQPSTK